MTFKIEYSIENEEIPIDEKETQTIQVLKLEIQTDYPNEPIQVKLDNSSSFGTQTDKEGICRCSTSEIKDYHVIVNIAGETFEEDIEIENEE